MLLLPSSTAFEVSGSRIALWPRVAVRREARPADICVQRVATDVNDVSRRRKEACGVCARLALGLLFNFSRPSYYILCVFVSRVSVCICVCVWGAGVSIYHRAGYLLLPYTVLVQLLSIERFRPAFRERIKYGMHDRIVSKLFHPMRKNSC